jgi:hypothetical protein
MRNLRSIVLSAVAALAIAATIVAPSFAIAQPDHASDRCRGELQPEGHGGRWRTD